MIARPRRTTPLAALTLGAALLAGCSTTPPGADAANSAARASSSPATASGLASSSSSSPRTSTATTGPAMALPKGVVDPAAGLVANAGTAKEGAPTLEVFEDFQCPVCAQAHQMLGKTINELAAAGKVRLVFHPMVFLDEKLGNGSSKAVTNAAACAADAADDAAAYLRYHDAAMSHQPSEGKGYTAAQIQQFAADAGLTGTQLATWKGCEAAKTYRAWVLASEETALASGVNGTPTFKLDGQELDLGTLSPDALVRAVDQAGK